MRLSTYTAKRDLKTSLEPKAKIKKKKTTYPIFVVQQHHAKHLHYDLRLEVDGVLKSWAIPKEPSLDPTVKRLAIMVEDHPYDYKDFEGIIPSGYGAGKVLIWDKGTYSVDQMEGREAEKLLKKGLKQGVLHFSLQGKKLKGIFHLIRLKNAEKNEWLFIKKREEKKNGKEAVSKKPVLTNLTKLFWPKEKITKGDLLSYYSQIAPFLLPYLKDRPVSLKRFPDGITGEAFFQKNWQNPPSWIQTVAIPHEKKEVHYLLIQNEESLLFAVNSGAIELHPFFSQVNTLNFPSFVIFDLDPKTASFSVVIQVAKAIHKLLEELNIPSYCKTSGATGLHIAIPLQGKYTYEQAKYFALLLAKIVHERFPKITTLERRIEKRKGKIYIDCYQNAFGQTIAAPYSVRARPSAPVSTPLDWKEVKAGLDPTKFTLKNILSRVKRKKDPYLPVLGKGIALEKILKQLAKLQNT